MCTDEVLVEGSVPERRIVRSDESDVCGMVRLRVISYQSPRPTAPDLPETMARSIRVSFQGLAENIRKILTIICCPSFKRFWKCFNYYLIFYIFLELLPEYLHLLLILPDLTKIVDVHYPDRHHRYCQSNHNQCSHEQVQSEQQKQK